MPTPKNPLSNFNPFRRKPEPLPEAPSVPPRERINTIHIIEQKENNNPVLIEEKGVPVVQGPQESKHPVMKMPSEMLVYSEEKVSSPSEIRDPQHFREYLQANFFENKLQTTQKQALKAAFAQLANSGYSPAQKKSLVIDILLHFQACTTLEDFSLSAEVGAYNFSLSPEDSAYKITHLDMFDAYTKAALDAYNNAAFILRQELADTYNAIAYSYLVKGLENNEHTTNHRKIGTNFEAALRPKILQEVLEKFTKDNKIGMEALLTLLENEIKDYFREHLYNLVQLEKAQLDKRAQQFDLTVAFLLISNPRRLELLEIIKNAPTQSPKDKALLIIELQGYLNKIKNNPQAQQFAQYLELGIKELFEESLKEAFMKASQGKNSTRSRELTTIYMLSLNSDEAMSILKRVAKDYSPEVTSLVRSQIRISLALNHNGSGAANALFHQLNKLTDEVLFSALIQESLQKASRGVDPEVEDYAAAYQYLQQMEGKEDVVKILELFANEAKHFAPEIAMQGLDTFIEQLVRKGYDQNAFKDHNRIMFQAYLQHALNHAKEGQNPKAYYQLASKYLLKSPFGANELLIVVSRLLENMPQEVADQALLFLIKALKAEGEAGQELAKKIEKSCDSFLNKSISDALTAAENKGDPNPVYRAAYKYLLAGQKSVNKIADFIIEESGYFKPEDTSLLYFVQRLEYGDSTPKTRAVVARLRELGFVTKLLNKEACVNALSQSNKVYHPQLAQIKTQILELFKGELSEKRQQQLVEISEKAGLFYAKKAEFKREHFKNFDLAAEERNVPRFMDELRQLEKNSQDYQKNYKKARLQFIAQQKFDLGEERERLRAQLDELRKHPTEFEVPVDPSGGVVDTYLDPKKATQSIHSRLGEISQELKELKKLSKGLSGWNPVAKNDTQKIYLNRMQEAEESLQHNQRVEVPAMEQEIIETLKTINRYKTLTKEIQTSGLALMALCEKLPSKHKDLGLSIERMITRKPRVAPETAVASPGRERAGGTISVRAPKAPAVRPGSEIKTHASERRRSASASSRDGFFSGPHSRETSLNRPSSRLSHPDTGESRKDSIEEKHDKGPDGRPGQ